MMLTPELAASMMWVEGYSIFDEANDEEVAIAWCLESLYRP